MQGSRANARIDETEGKLNNRVINAQADLTPRKRATAEEDKNDFR